MNLEFDAEHYYGFMLEAMSRFGSEGRHLEPHRWISVLRRRKPVWPMLAAVASEMRRRGTRENATCILEFGVFKGRSIRMLSRLFPECRLYGFDTFAGFPDDGRSDWKLDFSVPRLPQAPANTEFVIGPFEQTLAGFLRRGDLLPISLIHVDCDIFSAASTVLETLDDRIGPGTVIVFDELLNYAEFPENELLALYLFLQARNLDFEWFVTIGDLYPFEQACAGQQPSDAFVGYRDRCCYQNASIIIKAAGNSAHRIDDFIAQARRLVAQRPLQRPLPGS